MAASVGFEPTDACQSSTVFKTAAIIHSANSPFPHVVIDLMGKLSLAGDKRFELLPTESKSVVLPLHQSPICNSNNRQWVVAARVLLFSHTTFSVGSIYIPHSPRHAVLFVVGFIISGCYGAPKGGHAWFPQLVRYVGVEPTSVPTLFVSLMSPFYPI